jgi:toxin-antitoxin system PIN domain toxin
MMRLVDVNILIYAFREDAPGHTAYREWLEACVDSDEAYAVSDHVLAGFLRVSTHPRVFHPPTPIDSSIQFVEAYRHRANAVHIAPGPRHWDIFTRICLDSGAKGSLVPDAWLAALAIEHGCEFMTNDRDFSRFDGLRWRHPLNS